MLREQRPEPRHHLHPAHPARAQTIAALRAGAWVWCEKAAGATLADFDAVEKEEGARGAEEGPGKGTVGGPYASHRLSASLRVGHPACASAARRAGHGAAARGALPDHLVPRHRLLRGALARALGDRGWRSRDGHGIHQMDLLLDLLGPWSEVKAMAGRLVHDVETEDVSTALVRFENGAMAYRREQRAEPGRGQPYPHRL